MKQKKWTIIRWISVIFVSLFFVISYKADIQILEGCLTGSRFIGLHLIDPFATLQVIATNNDIPTNLIIGTVTILLFYFLVGGRAFCSWVCPYGLLSELGEKIHYRLVKAKMIKGGRTIPFSRFWFFALWLGLSFGTGLLIFEIFNVVGILSRFLIYGATFASLFIVAVLIIEILFAPRFWCRSVCPIGSAYGLLNYISLGRIAWEKDKCTSCGRCSKVCIEPDLLKFTMLKNDANDKEYVKGAGCIMCGCCIEVCPSKSISYRNRIKNLV